MAPAGAGQSFRFNCPQALSSQCHERGGALLLIATYRRENPSPVLPPERIGGLSGDDPTIYWRSVRAAVIAELRQMIGSVKPCVCVRARVCVCVCVCQGMYSRHTQTARFNKICPIT